MNVCGIVAEFDPFHNGHLHLINTVRDTLGNDCAIVAVMSGNFVQRGAAALFNKYTRTKAALLSGVDLVIELPVSYALSTAEKFTFGGVKALKDAGITSHIAFGSECGNVELLEKTAVLLRSEILSEQIKFRLQSGITYASARQNAVKDCFGSRFSDVLDNPNDILATGYLSAMQALGAKFTPIAVKRTGTAHNSTQVADNITSASNIRRLICDSSDFSGFLPNNSVYDLFVKDLDSGAAPVLAENAEKAILYKLRQMTKQDFARLTDVSEGLENRIYDAVCKASTLSELYSLIKTKRYTLARIKRLVLCAFLDIFSYEPAEYLRVLGFSENGANLLAQIKQKGSLPVVTSYKDVQKLSKNAQNQFLREAKRTDIYGLFAKNVLPCGAEFTAPVIKL